MVLTDKSINSHTIYREIMATIDHELAKWPEIAWINVWRISNLVIHTIDSNIQIESYDVITCATYAYSHFSLVTARSQRIETYEVDSCVCPWSSRDVRIRLTLSLASSNCFREREESPHIDMVWTTCRCFLWKNLYNTINDLRLC